MPDNERERIADDIHKILTGFNPQKGVYWGEHLSVADYIIADRRRVLKEINVELDSYANDYYVAPASKFYKIYDKLEELRKG